MVYLATFGRHVWKYLVCPVETYPVYPLEKRSDATSDLGRDDRGHESCNRTRSISLFISLNTGLERREMGEVIYEGKKVKLSGAVIPIIEPGNVCLNPIENYKTIKFE